MRKMKMFSKFAGMTAMAVSLLLSVSLSAMTDKHDPEGHVLVREWKKYSDAVSKDLPQSRADILEDIMDKAESRRLTWDFYDAVRKYYGTVRSYDWKKAQTLDEVLKERVLEYGSPVLVWNFAEVWPLYTDRAEVTDIAAMKELLQERNCPFYGQDRYIGNGRIPEYIAGNIGNDYEYLLWSALMYGYYSEPLSAGEGSAAFDTAADILEKHLGGRYPEAAYLEFLRTMRIPEDSAGRKKSALEAFVAEYQEYAVRFFAQQELLRMESDSLRSSGSAVSDDYSALREKCEAFMKAVKSEKGSEAELVKSCTYPSRLVEEMDFSRIKGEIAENTDTLRVILQNLDRAEVKVQAEDSTYVLETVLENAAGSYYVPDTLSIVLPETDDGRYRVTCIGGDRKASFNYDRYSLSMAWQKQKDGYALYLADFKTGRPVEKADVAVYYRDSLIRTIPNMEFDGFTLVDMDFPEENGRYYLQCSCTDDGGMVRKTEKYHIGTYGYAGSRIHEGPSALLYKNMAAFHPGDTLKFKAVLFETYRDSSSGHSVAGYRVLTGKETVIAELLDPLRNTVAADTLYANDFGSVSGWFRLPVDRMNGWYTLSVKSEGQTLASDALSVDDFVLPTFSVSFDPVGEIYFPGDSVTVKGRIESYSGVSLAAARTTCSVSLWNEKIQESGLEIAEDGTFSVAFKTKSPKNGGEYFHYNIDVTVTEATGESHVFSKGLAVHDFSFGAEVENEAEMSVSVPDGTAMDAEADSADVYEIKALEGDFAVLSFILKNASYEEVPGRDIAYTVYREGVLVHSGEAKSGEKVWIDLSSWPSGVFRLKAVVSVDGREKTCVCDLVKTSENDTSLAGSFRHFIKVLPAGDICVQFGASAGPVWAAVQLFGDRNTCLLSDMLYLDGRSGRDGSLRLLEYDFKDGYPDVVQMKITYFRDGSIFRFDHDFKRQASDLMLPLTFSRFTDKSMPGTVCRYEIRTLPGVECAVSVFDMTTETVSMNWWNRFEPYFLYPSVQSSYVTGGKHGYGSSSGYHYYGNAAVPFQLAEAAPRFAASSALEDTESALTNSVMKKDVLTRTQADGVSGVQSVTVRDDFSETLAFYPFLRSDEDGKISFEFTAGDKLSTYYVSVFAHDRSMNNNALRRKMQISLPVTVSVAQPAYLFSGDRYDMQVALSNVSGEDSEGTLSLYLYDGTDYVESMPFLVKSRPVKVSAGSAVPAEFSLDVPAGTDTLGMKVIYQAHSVTSSETGKLIEGASDGLFVTVPVRAPEQILYETHSALLLHGMSRDSLYRALQSEFVNVSGYGAVSEEISILDMLLESIPGHVVPESPDVISVMSACLASYLASALEVRSGSVRDLSAAVSGSSGAEELAGQVLSYQNAGGGFAWLKGGQSSPLVTAVVLEYVSILEGKGLLEEDSPLTVAAERAVAYLDASYFAGDKSWSSLSLPQYLFIRSLYNDLPLTAGPDRKTLKSFRKSVRNYLLNRESDAPGYILYKARRAMTLLNFLSGSDYGSGSGMTFLKSANIRANAGFISSLDRYMASLKEYAVGHRSGGQYFPNAVMPFRGLLESELYAHSVLCRLMSLYAEYSGDEEASRIADGVRLWIMVQKETQEWDDDPAYLLALDAVMDGSSGLLDSRVLVLTRKYMKPFGEIRAAGNDVSVRCRYLVEDASASVVSSGSASSAVAEYSGYREMAEGEVLRIGERILAVYEIWSAENRSYVRLSAPRPASLRPENQLSGMYRVPVRPRTRAGVPAAAFPYSYREVKQDCCRWFLEVLPEENTVLTEVLTVTQAGVFSSPVAEVECLYAPHYRANDGSLPQLVSEK